MSFQLSITPHRRAAARFVDAVHRKLLKAFSEAPEVSQTDIANALGVHRSVINRQMRGKKDMSLSRIAEIAYLLGYEADFNLVKPEAPQGSNIDSESAKLANIFKVEQFPTTYSYDHTKKLNLQLVNEDA